MLEALEQWSTHLMKHVLPRHYELLKWLNRVLLEQICPDISLAEEESVRKLGLAQSLLPLDEANELVYMGNLCVWLSRKVNGVAKVHSELLKSDLFKGFYQLMGDDKFTNVTNGITPRRWLLGANPKLAESLTQRIGDGWITDLSQVAEIKKYDKDPVLKDEIRKIRYQNKNALAQFVRNMTGVILNTESLFDVQIKRIHEYKRQLLNVLHIVHRYLKIKNGELSAGDVLPRTFIFAGKAAPSYKRAREIISLIHAVGQVINTDRAVRDLIHVIFIPDYNVTRAEKIIPAADLSEQISLAGTEASGTGNMKLALNGALTIGTRDGANIEMSQSIGEEDMFLFGLSVKEVQSIKGEGYDPSLFYRENADIAEVLEFIRTLSSSRGEEGAYVDLVRSLLDEGDTYMLLADFQMYIDRQRDVDNCYKTPDIWFEKVIRNIGSMGYFSADRSIKDYAEHIWKTSPIAKT